MKLTSLGKDSNPRLAVTMIVYVSVCHRTWPVHLWCPFPHAAIQSDRSPRKFAVGTACNTGPLIRAAGFPVRSAARLLMW